MNPSNDQSVSDSVKTLRKQIQHQLIEHDMSRPELARAAGLSADTLDNLWKTGRKKPLYADDLYRISQVFDCAMEELLTGALPEPASETPYSHKVQYICDELNRMSPEELDRAEIALAVARAIGGR